MNASAGRLKRLEATCHLMWGLAALGPEVEEWQHGLVDAYEADCSPHLHRGIRAARGNLRRVPRGRSLLALSSRPFLQRVAAALPRALARGRFEQSSRSCAPSVLPSKPLRNVDQRRWRSLPTLRLGPDKLDVGWREAFNEPAPITLDRERVVRHVPWCFRVWHRESHPARLWA